jgi:hypothetical protein
MDFLKIAVPIVLLVVAVVFGSFSYGVHINNQGCQYICDGNGDENAFKWQAGCWCRDEEGLYNPRDSREK